MTNHDDNIFDNPDFKTGMEVGHDLGRYDAEAEAQRAFNMGEIELWLEHYRPKSIEEWAEYDAKNGPDFSDRWAAPKDFE